MLDREHLASLLSDIGFGPVPSDRMFDLFDKDGNGEVRLKKRAHLGWAIGLAWLAVILPNTLAVQRGPGW